MSEASSESTGGGMRIGYARCSTEKQDLRAQKHALAQLAVDRVFTDEGFSGTKRDSRHGLEQALAALRAGDTLVVTKLDRLARSVPDARTIADDVQATGARIQLGSMVYDPHDPMGKMFFNMLATFAEFEADIARMRTREGMAEARRAGKLKGKQPTFTRRQDAEVRRMRDSGDYTISEIAELFSTTRPTIYRSLARTSPDAAADEDGQLPGQHSIPVPLPTRHPEAAAHGHATTAPAEASTTAEPGGQPEYGGKGQHSGMGEPPASVPSKQRSSAPSRGARKPKSKRRRYTSEQLDAYHLEPVRSDTGEILRYSVVIAGDVLGTIERAPYGRGGWHAHYPAGGVAPHSGQGRYATNREKAVIDLLLGLGITSH